MPEIVVVEYDPQWPAAFAAEQERVAAAVGDAAAAIEHIGSTAVPGLPAKPILDVVVGLRDMAAVPAAVMALAELGYERAPDGDFPGRVFLRRAAHHLSLTPYGGAYWNDQLAFRDALRSDPKLRDRYARLKRRLAATHEDQAAYTRAKTDLVRDALLAAGHTPRSGWAAERDR
jgi:GrpB-like predicted nucleotidyltransferase (UPF0157 family)